MKTLKLGLIVAIAVTSFSSCKKSGFCFKGDGNIITEQRDLTEFSQISLATSADIHFIQSDDYSVEIKASENLMSIIETEVVNSKLKIKRKNNTCLRGGNPIHIYISAPDISRFAISGSGNVEAKGLFVANNLELSVSGSGDFRFDSLDVDDIDISISGSGDMALFGIDTASTQKIKISGSGDISAFDLPVYHSTISIAGSGNCKIHAVDELDVKISGSGDVLYKGQPAVNSNISGSGSLRHF